LTAALQGAVAAETPFRGSFQAVETHAVQFPKLLVAGSGTGNATHLGKFIMTYDAEVNLLNRVGIGSVEFIAANGDRVFADLLGQSTLTATPNLVSIVEVLTITGGTGRFAGATRRRPVGGRLPAGCAGCQQGPCRRVTLARSSTTGAGGGHPGVAEQALLRWP